MEVYLAKLPKDMLIEIIKKGFDMEYLSKEELHKMYKESKEKLSKKMQESNFNKDNDRKKILSENEDHKIVIEWGYKGKLIKMFLLTADSEEYDRDKSIKSIILYISIPDSKIGFDWNLFNKFENFDELLQIAEKRITEVRNCYKITHTEINWDLLREMYEDCLIWNELGL